MNFIIRISVVIIVINFLFPQIVEKIDPNAPVFPDWTTDAVWYQIFPERFRNGDAQNDPDIHSLAGTWPYDLQLKWDITPWTDDWYKLQPWEDSNKRGFYYNAQLRRYGGDILGIIEKLDYLKELGINAIYLNPVFESPSSHKYGAVYYHHIDNNFGPSPDGDAMIWATEDPADPSTWKFTTADRLFLALIEEVHARGMHIIIDGVFNHVGIPFWALEDVKRNGKISRYADWFTITSWDDPDTPQDEFDYEGWYGIRDLPELREDENGLIDPVADHVHAIVKRWMDPNGDGDTSDGIDGWRIDVAEMVNLEFWKKFRGWVEEINPNAYITGEVWWEDYSNNVMFNAAPWIQGDAFHSVMNYRFGDAVYKYFLFENDRITTTAFDTLLNDIIEDYSLSTLLNMQNLINSHDTERLASACVNPDRLIDHDNNLQHSKDYLVRKPNEYERNKQKLAVGFQMVFPGTPFIYYGDEAGMWGADDPDERKPMVWKEFTYEDEASHPFGDTRPVDEIKFDQSLFDFYKEMIRLRRTNPALQRGNYKVLVADDERSLFAFKREYMDSGIIALFNSGKDQQSFSFGELGISGDNDETWNASVYSPIGKTKPFKIDGQSFIVYVKN